MKKIPAVYKSVMVTPEQVIFEVGDWVKLYDFSFLMSYNSHSFEDVGWKRAFSDALPILGHQPKMKILEMNLKVPCPAYNDVFNFELDIDEKIIYLDTLIKDVDGHIWLTLLRFLGE